MAEILVRLRDGTELVFNNEGDMYRDRWVVKPRGPAVQSGDPQGLLRRALAIAGPLADDYQWAVTGMPGHDLALDVARAVGGVAVLPPVPPLPPGAIP